MPIRTTLAVLTLSIAAFSHAAVRSSMLVSTDWLSGNLSDPRLVLLHVSNNRTAYDAGHLPGARFLATADFVVTREGVSNELPAAADLKLVFEAAGVRDGSRIVLYGDSSLIPVTRAYFTLDYLGLGDNAALLDGGLEKWRAEGKPLSKDAPAASQGSFTPKLRPELVAQMSQVTELSKTAALVDARSAAEYRGEKGSHIPGALNIYWMDNLTGGSNQTFKQESDLRMLYEAAGIKQDRTAVAYCNSGMQATGAYFTLKYLGYNVKVYDGSFSEWTAKNAPVEK